MAPHWVMMHGETCVRTLHHHPTWCLSRRALVKPHSLKTATSSPQQHGFTTVGPSMPHHSGILGTLRLHDVTPSVALRSRFLLLVPNKVECGWSFAPVTWQTSSKPRTNPQYLPRCTTPRAIRRVNFHVCANARGGASRQGSTARGVDLEGEMYLGVNDDVPGGIEGLGGAGTAAHIVLPLLPVPGQGAHPPPSQVHLRATPLSQS